MKTTVPVALLAIALIGTPGCYETSGSGSPDLDTETTADPPYDPPSDPPVEDWICDEAVVAVEQVIYNTVVFPMTPIGLVIEHENAATVRLLTSPVSADNVIEAQVLGYPWLACLCDDGMWCGPHETLVTLSSFEMEGLPPGDYILRINGVDYPLKVAGPECLTYTTTIQDVIYEPSIMRGDEYAVFDITSFGHSCDCGGAATAEPRVSLETSEIWIDVTEVVCDPEQCCDMCDCIDTYENTVYVWLDTWSHYLYTVHVNGNDYELRVWCPAE